MALIALTKYGVHSLSTSRIIGGSDTVSGEYPHVALLWIDNVHVCVGSIISEEYHLTAADCVVQMERLT